MNGSTTVPKKFYLPSGHLVNPAYWYTNEPNNFGGNDTYVKEGCLDMSLYGYFKLNDEECGFTRDVYCEYF